MQRTLQDFVVEIFAALSFAVLFVPLGYLFGLASNLANFRRRSLPERMLWAICLSTPLSILQSVYTGRYLPLSAGVLLTLLATCVWAGLIAAELWRGRLLRLREWDRPTRIALVAMLCLGVYCLLATLGITHGRKLYEGTYAGDWSVRIPLTAAALRSGLPIPSPFYGVDGQSAPLRYYYYWYVLCGQLGRLAHVSARAALAASSVWSAFALFAALFLYAKYLFVPSAAERSHLPAAVTLRWLCVWMLPVSCILGLDIVPTLISVMMRPIRLYPEMEWWRSQGDYSLSFHTAVLYAPHHTAGLVCCMLGFLLLTLGMRRDSEVELSLSAKLICALTASLCFAAAIGTSTYLTVIFSIACVALAIERALRRDMGAVLLIALAGVVAFPLSATYLHEALSGSAASLHSADMHAGHARFLSLFPRNVGLPRVELIMLGHVLHRIKPFPWWLRTLLRPTLTILLYATELGFFGFVLAWRAWADLRRPSELSDSQRMQWVLCCSLGFAALCLTSQPVIGVNDLGRHAGLALRFVAVLWATPLLLRAKYDRAWPVLQNRLLRRVVCATVVLGLCAQVWQVAVQRTYFWLVDHGVVVYPFAPFPRFVHYGQRYFETREAFEALDRAVPPAGRVQFNPATTYWTLMGDYLHRPVAAFDQECQAAFGGDLQRCRQALPAIRGLFGGGHPITGTTQAFDPAGITPAAFYAVCKQHQLRALVATASDRVWPEKQSWLWMRPAVFSNASVRVVACPASGTDKPQPQ